MCKPIGTDGGRKHWVLLKKEEEIKAAKALKLQVEQHPNLGSVVACNSWYDATTRASEIRAAVIG